MKKNFFIGIFLLITIILIVFFNNPVTEEELKENAEKIKIFIVTEYERQKMQNPDVAVNDILKTAKKLDEHGLKLNYDEITKEVCIYYSLDDRVINLTTCKLK